MLICCIRILLIRRQHFMSCLQSLKIPTLAILSVSYDVCMLMIVSVHVCMVVTMCVHVCMVVTMCMHVCMVVTMCTYVHYVVVVVEGKRSSGKAAVWVSRDRFAVLDKTNQVTVCVCVCLYVDLYVCMYMYTCVLIKDFYLF